VYVLATICLGLGILVGALFHGPAHLPAATATADHQAPPVGGAEQMRSQAPSDPARAVAPAVVVDPVYEKVKSDPNNFDLLSQAGNAEMRAGAPTLAVEYYLRALKVKEDSGVRINLGNAYFRAGDTDQSLAEFAEILKADPKNDKALFNTGMVKFVGKKDAKGAIASWETFLKYHPDHPHKAQVLEMIERVKQGMKAQG